MEAAWFDNFHFIRPQLLWLLLVIPVLWLSNRYHSGRGAWQQVIAPHLLRYLLLHKGKKQFRAGWLGSVLSLLAIFALAGPSFRQQPVPVFNSEAARVILLDLSLSMEAQDINPSRLERAKFKVHDILQASQEGSVALVVYAGEAFVISPLTNDANTIEAMIPVLSSGIMPVLGSAPDKGLKLARQLLENAGQADGQIIWITDGIDGDQINKIESALADAKLSLSILAIGTEQGAPIPLPQNNGFLKDASGNIVVPRLETKYLQQIADQVKGQLLTLTADDSDVTTIMNQLSLTDTDFDNVDPEKNQREISRWLDDGYWLVWIILGLSIWPILRRGQLKLFANILPLLFFSLLLFSPAPSATASVWDDLWQTKDQQAKQLFDKKAYDKAAGLFEDKHWQGAAHYKSGHFEQSLDNWQNPQTSDDFYNRGNALAKTGKLDEAIEAYNHALELNPDNKDAEFNKQLLEKLQQEQQQQDKQKQEQQNQDQDQQQNQQQDSQDADGNQDNQQNQDASQQQKQQQQQDQSEQEQQSAQQNEQEVQLSEDERSEKEKDQALKHWLEKIPDDPGGLLRRKMYREYQKRGRRQSDKKVW